MSAVSANGCFKHDDSMEKTGLFYARYMDDWVVIAPTRWKLRSAIRIVNKTLGLLKIEQHPDNYHPVGAR